MCIFVCPAYYFYTVKDIDSKLGRNDHQHMKLCAPKKEVTPYLFLRVMPLFRLRKCVFFISPKRLEGFSLHLCQIFTSLRRCAEPMFRPYRFKVKVTLDGQRFEPVFRVRSISQKRLEGFSWNLCQMFTSWRRCAEPMFRPYRFKVKVAMGRHPFLRKKKQI